MTDLNTCGWNDELNRLKQESTRRALTLARVTVVHRTCYEIISEKWAVSMRTDGKHGASLFRSMKRVKRINHF